MSGQDTEMKVIERQRIERLSDGFRNERPGRRPARLIQGFEVDRCYFHDCTLSMTRYLELRTTVRNVCMNRCEVEHCGVWSAIFEDCVVDGLKTWGHLKIWGAVFKHVTLRGKIGSIGIDHPYPPEAMDEPPDADQPISRANEEYYKDVDWALDISQAEFKDLDLRSVPARLVRRDPETQVVVKREKLLDGRWKELVSLLEGTWWPTSLDWLLAREDEDVVLVAPKRDRKFPLLLEGLKLLRQAGIAEPN